MSWSLPAVDSKTLSYVAGAVGSVLALGGAYYWSHQKASPRDASIPAKAKALVLKKLVQDVKDCKDCFAVEDVEVPVPGPGEVLVKMSHSPINPSDMMFVQGHYLKAPKIGGFAGFEGAGTVVQTGPGVLGWKLLNKRVGVIGGEDGVWRQYARVPAQQCVILPDDVSFEEGCAPFVNPWTVIGMIETAKKKGLKAIVHTAAASALGKMLIRMAKKDDIEVICVVRKPDQAAACKAAGAKYVLNLNDEKFESELKAVTAETKCTLAFDAIAGKMSGILMRNMPPLSEVAVYGALSGQEATAGPGDLIAGKVLKGFWLNIYVQEASLMHKMEMVGKVQKNIKTDLRTDVIASYPLDKVTDALAAYQANMSAGKVTIAPFATEVQQKK